MISVRGAAGRGLCARRRAAIDPAKTKQLIAVAAAHVTQCPYCIRAHTRAAMRRGASAEEIMEAIWVAAEMRAGAAYAHAALALDTIAAEQAVLPSQQHDVVGTAALARVNTGRAG